MSPEVVCPGQAITFTVSGVTDNGGIKRVDCVAKQGIEPVSVTYTWEITKAGGGGTITGGGPVATVVTDALGTYSCTFTARANRECPPAPLTIGPETTNVTVSATLDASPSSIAASTDWPEMPADVNQSQIAVTWDPPQCAGTLHIVEIDPPQGDQGTLTQTGATVWRYEAFAESDEFCPEVGTVWIAAFHGEQELARTSILVWPVHIFLTTGPTTNFPMDYGYISWKYAAVLATTQGGFTPPITFSANASVSCRGTLAYACTDIGAGTVVFGTSTFTGSENQAASIIGHELLHTTAVTDECVAYQWEADHTFGTGTTPCDTAYIVTVLQYLSDPRNDCP